MQDHDSLRTSYRFVNTIRYPTVLDGDHLLQQQMMAIDPFSFRWHDTLMAAMKHRLTPAEPGIDSICIHEATFDRLLAIAEMATAANTPPIGAAEFRVSRNADGTYISTLENPIIGSASATEPTLLESIIAVKRAFDAKIEERIR